MARPQGWAHRHNMWHTTLVRVGAVGGKPHYTLPAQVPVATLFLRARVLKREWQGLRAEARFAGVHGCNVPSLAFGRALQLGAELRTLGDRLTALVRELDAFATAPAAADEGAARSKATKRAAHGLQLVGPAPAAHGRGQPPTWQDEARLLAERVRDLGAQVLGVTDGLAEASRRLSTSSVGVPSDVRLDAVGWTVDDLYRFTQPFWVVAQRAKRPADLNTALRTTLRRMSNAAYVSTVAPLPEQRARYLLDRTDVMFYAAVAWGGRQSQYHGQIARRELDTLRDARFVLASLASMNYEHRLTAVSCLAFLTGDDVREALRAVAVTDTEPGVRQAAIWAYGAAGGEDALAFARVRAVEDPAPRVRDAAAAMATEVEGSSRGWWVL